VRHIARSDYCMAVALVHLDRTVTCSLEDCPTNGSLYRHVYFVPCTEVLDDGCPSCLEGEVGKPED